MTDEGGVLGNLPNSRPGKRSAKRDRPAGTAAKAAARAEAGGKAAAKPPRTSKAARTSPKPGAAAAGKASPRGRTTAASQRQRTAAVKGPGSGDRVDLDGDIRREGRHDPGSAGTPGDAVGAVVRGAAGLAVTGAKVAGAVTQELLRRLPRR
jgi:hypothetical protein